jgi:hypothetical protein
MLNGARKPFMKDADLKEGEAVEIMEITMRNLLSAGSLDHTDFLARADTINAVGKMVLISNYAEYYKLAAYLQRYTQCRIGIVMGIPNLKEIFDAKYYDSLAGGILESFGRLFKNDLKLYVYPYLDPSLNLMTSIYDITIPDNLTHLYKHLLDNKFIEPITDYNREYLGIFSRHVLAKIRDNDDSWEQMVPPEVAERIKERMFFGYNKIRE